MTEQQKTALAQIAAAAIACERATGCPAEISMAQCIFESGWLSKAPGNNCFGIKSHWGVEDWQLIATHEWFTDQEATRFLAADWRRKATQVKPVQRNGARKLYDVQDTFAAYGSLADCFADHARIIQNGPYAAAWTAFQADRDLDAYIAGIAKRYATDPGYLASVRAEAHSATVGIALASLRAEAK